MNNSRRNFIKQSMIVSVGFTGLSRYLLGCSSAPANKNLVAADRWLELPEGFSAKIISKWGDKMSDGLLVPGRADGMATFAVGDKVVIIRNHENSPKPFENSAFGEDRRLLENVAKEDFFDYGFGKTPGLGGTTTLVYNEQTQQVEDQYLSLAGTNRNCAGGPTPWNSWISCEEDVTPAGRRSETSHGFNFEVPASHKGIIKPVPLKQMGRFNHEAVCVSPETNIVYQTEDRGDGLIYRYLSNVPGELQKGGILQALSIKGQPGFDTRNYGEANIAVNQELEVEWITLSDVDTAEDDLRYRGNEAGAAVFARGEGMWYGNKELFFACTNGGKNKTGQVFKYVPSPNEGTSDEKDAPGKLVLFAEPNDKEILKACDNLTVAPWGDVILVEDSSDAYIRGITPQGKIYNIGRNIGSDSELAGICFSPSGNTLFVNIQEQGLTFAVTGPWDKLAKTA